MAMNNSADTKQQLTDLMTLQQAYSIDYNMRGYWRVKFDDNGICDVPEKYKRYMLAESCTETSFSLNTAGDKLNLGSTIVILPNVIADVAGITISMYDDAEGTIERWYRHWRARVINFGSALNYIEDFAKTATVYQYNSHHKLISSRPYILAPTQTLQIVNGQQADIAKIDMNFAVYNLAIPDDVTTYRSIQSIV